MYNSNKINVQVNSYCVWTDQMIYIRSLRKQGERGKAAKTNLSKLDFVKYVLFPSLIHWRSTK